LDLVQGLTPSKKEETKGRAGSSNVEANASSYTNKETTLEELAEIYRVLLETRALKEGGDVEGGEQTTGKKKHRNRKRRCKHRPRNEKKVIHR
jgi:hypothetical protein